MSDMDRRLNWFFETNHANESIPKQILSALERHIGVCDPQQMQNYCIKQPSFQCLNHRDTATSTDFQKAIMYL